MAEEGFDWPRYSDLLDELKDFADAGQMGHWLVDRPLLELRALRKQLMRRVMMTKKDKAVLAEPLISVDLTERQWDHVLLSIENDLIQDVRSLVRRESTGAPMVGFGRMIARYVAIYETIVEVLGWDESGPNPALWRLLRQRMEEDRDVD